MGGIKLVHVAELVARGATRIAVVTALTQAPDIAAETDRWIETIKTAGFANRVASENNHG
jgi:thiamine monophosphate synthase